MRLNMIMDYPKVDTVAKVDMKNEVESTFAVIKSCVRQVYDSNNVYEKVDMDPADLDEFIESMSHEQFQKVQTFFDTMPKVKHLVKVKNPKTGVESEVVLQGMQDFFLVALSHNSLENYYKTNFGLMQHHNYSLTEIEEMMPWEREIYITLLMQHLEEEKRKRTSKTSADA